MVGGLFLDGARRKRYVDLALGLSIDSKVYCGVKDDFPVKLVYCFLAVIRAKETQFQISSAINKQTHTPLMSSCQDLV